ncbi:hypothetical protein A3711_13305 [Erythrobacter sp. HI00D59]|nr:hypothetical protein A3711_13305 [Erythrobacter sp. HI00D59]
MRAGKGEKPHFAGPVASRLIGKRLKHHSTGFHLHHMHDAISKRAVSGALCKKVGLDDDFVRSSRQPEPNDIFQPFEGTARLREILPEINLGGQDVRQREARNAVEAKGNKRGISEQGKHSLSAMTSRDAGPASQLEQYSTDQARADGRKVQAILSAGMMNRTTVGADDKGLAPKGIMACDAHHQRHGVLQASTRSGRNEIDYYRHKSTLYHKA